LEIFIIGISGGIGRLLSRKLLSLGDRVRGLVRHHDQGLVAEAFGATTLNGNLAEMTARELADAFGTADAVVFTAGSNGGSREATDAIDGDGVKKSLAAARIARIDRFALVSVLPESWRERELNADAEHYFAVKKKADIAVTRSGLNWLILRPSLLADWRGRGTVSLGPAELHGQIAREDVAGTLAKLLHEPRINRQILEVNAGFTAIHKAVEDNVFRR
jgi:uncharacterized protein YbjT (DUF2867 family)